MLKRSIRDNIAVGLSHELSCRTGVMNRRAENEECWIWHRRWGSDINRSTSLFISCRLVNVSGWFFARAAGVEPKLLLLDEQMHGLDGGAKYKIYSLLQKFAECRCSVSSTSTDLPEFVCMCDRILIMQEGAQSEIIAARGLQPSELFGKFYSSNFEERHAS